MNFFQRLMFVLFAKKTDLDELKICFYMEANLYGEHGRLNVSHIKHGLIEKSIPFVFVGVTTPPKMDRVIFDKIWIEAKRQGYIPHHMEAYGTINEIFDTNELLNQISHNDTLAASRHAAATKASAVTLQSVGNSVRG